MGFRSRLQTAGQVLLGIPMVEAASSQRGGVVGELDGFREMAGSGARYNPERDLTPLEHDQHVKLADHLATRNPMGRRMVQVMGEMTLGAGVEYTLGKEAPDSCVEWVNAFWDDNNMDELVPSLAEGVSRHGERILPVAVDPAGRMRLGFVHSNDVERVDYTPGTDRPTVVVLKGNQPEEARTFSVVRKYQDADEDQPPDVEADQYDGDIVYLYVNRSQGQRRGLSDLLAFSDWLDVLDELPFVALDRARTLLNVFFDVTLDGMNETEIAAWLETATAPTPGSIRAHNEHVTWDLKAPELAATEVHQLYRDVKEHVLGNAGLPLHWFGTGEGGNRATAGEMTMPTMRMLAARTKYLLTNLRVIVDYALDLGVRAGSLKQSDRDKCAVSFTVSELEDSKVGALGSAFQQVTNAVQLMVDAGLVSKGVAKRVAQLLLAQLGVEYDPEDDEKALETEQGKEADEGRRIAEEAVERLRVARAENDPPPGPGKVAPDGAPGVAPGGTVPRDADQLDPKATLNGAQVKAMVDLAAQVGAGSLPKKSALTIMQLAFGLSPEEAASILDPVQEGGTKPKPPAPFPPKDDDDGEE